MHVAQPQTADYYVDHSIFEYIHANFLSLEHKRQIKKHPLLGILSVTQPRIRHFQGSVYQTLDFFLIKVLARLVSEYAISFIESYSFDKPVGHKGWVNESYDFIQVRTAKKEITDLIAHRFHFQSNDLASIITSYVIPQQIKLKMHDQNAKLISFSLCEDQMRTFVAPSHLLFYDDELLEANGTHLISRLTYIGLTNRSKLIREWNVKLNLPVPDSEPIDHYYDPLHKRVFREPLPNQTYEKVYASRYGTGVCVWGFPIL